MLTLSTKIVYKIIYLCMIKYFDWLKKQYNPFVNLCFESYLRLI